MFILFIQANELRKALYAKDVPAEVYVGMRYWHPFTEEAIEQVRDIILAQSIHMNWNFCRTMRLCFHLMIFFVNCAFCFV